VDTAKPVIVGCSPSLDRIRSIVPRLAQDQTPLVIIGETGVGKTLLASAVHDESSLRLAPLIIVNFSLLGDRDQRIALLGGEPPELTTTRRSALEIHSTVILKHIDHLTPFLQDELVHVLQTKKIIRLGSKEPRSLVARPVFTLRLVPAMLHRQGRITGSLFTLLKGLQAVTIPPLRKRMEDIPLLAKHFLHRYYEGLHSPVNRNIRHVRGLGRSGRVDPALLKTLLSHRWTGNVLELKAYLRSLLVHSYDDLLLDAERLELSKMLLLLEEGHEFSLRGSLLTIERGIIGRALERYGDRISTTAQMLGLSDRAIRRRSI
jgi:DNA-binding NtrC family response regulator